MALFIRTPDEVADELSQALGREVNLVSNVWALQPRDPAMESEYQLRGVACRIEDDGSLTMAVKPLRGFHRNMLYSAIYSVCRAFGAEGLLSPVEMQQVALSNGMFLGDMNEVNVKAFISSLSYTNVTNLRIVRDILQVKLGRFDLPEGLESAMCNGLHHHRREKIAEMCQANDEKAIAAFARETMSPYACHRHIHLGRPDGAMRAMGFPDMPMVVDVNGIRNQMNYMDGTLEEVLDSGFIEKLRHPVAVIRNAKEDGYRLVLDMVNKEGNVVILTVPSQDKMREGTNKLGGFGAIAPDTLCRVVAYREEGEFKNLIYAEKERGSEVSLRLVSLLRRIKSEGPLHRAGAQDAFANLLNRTTKVLQFFKNPKNFDDLSKKIAEDIRFLEKNASQAPGEPAETMTEAPSPAPEKAGARAESLADATPENKRRSLPERLATPVKDGPFSAAAKKKLEAAGVADAAAVLSRLSGDRRIERFREDFGPKALRNANEWLRDLGLGGVAFSARQDVEAEAKAIAPEGLARLDFFRAFKEFPRDAMAGTLAMPVSADGRAITGADAYQIVARMAATNRWEGCNVFFDEAQLTALGLKPAAGAEPVYLTSRPGAPVWNMMDVAMGDEIRGKIAERYRDEGVAVPAAMLRQIATYAPSSAEDAEAVAKHLDEVFPRIAGEAVPAAVETFETALMKETEAMKKTYDPTDLLQRFGLKASDRQKLYLMGEVEVHGMINRRAVEAYESMRTPMLQKVDITLRLEGGAIAVHNWEGIRFRGAMKDVLSKGKGLEKPQEPTPPGGAAGEALTKKR